MKKFCPEGYNVERVRLDGVGAGVLHCELSTPYGRQAMLMIVEK